MSTLPNAPEYSVTEASMALKRTVEDAFEYIRIRGEISGFKRSDAGHWYLNLKDDKSVMAAVCWRGVTGSVPFFPQDGMEVVCVGKITTYPGRSTYQLMIERMNHAGLGALMALLEKRKQQLAAEGLFDAARKKPLPYLPKVIGVVTSPTGAVIRDILHRITDRFPCHVLVWPVLVQGEQAAGQIAAAISGFNALPKGGAVPRPDVLIVARGGGSFEDLWPFNEENVVRAAAASNIPLISAVGHETDTTLIDYAADRRAPTPTAAAEMAVPVRGELVLGLRGHHTRLLSGIQRSLTERQQSLLGLERGLPKLPMLLANATQRLDDLQSRLKTALPALLSQKEYPLAALAPRLRPAALMQSLQRQQQQLSEWHRRSTQAIHRYTNTQQTTLVALVRLLESFNYHNVLQRGFALVRDKAGKPLTSAKAVTTGALLQIELQDGAITALASGDHAARPSAKKKEQADRQGNLF